MGAKIAGRDARVLQRVRNSDISSHKKQIVLICGGIILGFGAEILVIVGTQALAGEIEIITIKTLRLSDLAVS